MKANEFQAPDCKRFNGYKPCFPYKTCYDGCVEPDRQFGKMILIINLDAMGDVLMTTAQLAPLKRKYPHSYIAWLTLKSAAPLLKENPYIDDVFVWEPESWLILEQMRFDLVLNADKSRRSCAFTMKLKSEKKLGFGLNEKGQIVPLKDYEVRELARTLLGIEPKCAINEYGMTELCSQLYDATSFNYSGVADGNRMKLAPPWMRPVALDPVTLRHQPDRQIGLMAFFDLANVGSISAIMTEDLGYTDNGAVAILGRAAASDARGCGLAIEQFAAEAASRHWLQE